MVVVPNALLPKRELTDDERESIQDCLDGAYAVKNKQLTLTEFMRLGIVEYQGHPSPRYTRWLATGLGSSSDPRWQALQKILDWTVRKQHIVTPQGVYQSDQISQHAESIRNLRNPNV